MALSAREHAENHKHDVVEILGEPGWRCTDCPARSVAWFLEKTTARQGEDKQALKP